MTNKKKAAPKSISYTIITPLSKTEVRWRLVQYLRLLGYEQVDDRPVVYERASSWKHLIWFSPKGVRARLQIELWTDDRDETIVSLELFPIYDPRLISLHETDWRFWQRELEGLEAAIQGDEQLTSGSQQAAIWAAAFGGTMTLAALMAIVIIAVVMIWIMQWLMA